MTGIRAVLPGDGSGSMMTGTLLVHADDFP
jgi:hypothetical protein